MSYPKCQTPRIRAKAFFFKPSSEIFGSLYWVIFGNLQKTLGHFRKSLEDAVCKLLSTFWVMIPVCTAHDSVPPNGDWQVRGGVGMEEITS